MWEVTRHGNQYLEERVYDPLTGRSRVLAVKIPNNSKQARKEAREALLAKLEEQKPKKMRLSDLIELYKQEMKISLRYSTYKRNCCALDSMMNLLDDVYLDALKAGYVREKLINAEGKTNTWRNELLKRFKSMLMWAYRSDFIGREVPDKLVMFKDQTKKERIADKYLEQSELNDLIGAMSMERWKLLTEFLALSGLRIGEAMALNNDDITSEYITVSKTFSVQYRTLNDPKTVSSYREVYIQPELEEVIKKIRVCMMRQRMKFGYKDEGYFFSGTDGDRIQYAAYAKYLKETAAKVVPDKQVTPHTLRHTMTSLLAENGVPLEVISRRLGHDSSDITKQIYLHITKEQKNRDNAEIRSIYLLG